MNVPGPSESGYTIYTKLGCKYCTHAKKMFPDALLYACDEWLKERDAFLRQMDKYTDGHRTFPMIFKDGEFIGGYAESVNKILTDLDF